MCRKITEFEYKADIFERDSQLLLVIRKDHLKCLIVQF